MTTPILQPLPAPATPTACHPAADRSSFLEAMSRVAMAVHIVTTDGGAGRDGLVVSAMSSVSADMRHPTLLVCVKATSRPASIIEANGVFCVNVLAEKHAGLSESFAGRSGGRTHDWFGQEKWSRLHTGAPALDGALANFDCRIAEIAPMGTHLVIFGSVLAVRVAPGRPLLHANRAYQRLSP